jgi:porin
VLAKYVMTTVVLGLIASLAWGGTGTIPDEEVKALIANYRQRVDASEASDDLECPKFSVVDPSVIAQQGTWLAMGAALEEGSEPVAVASKDASLVPFVDYSGDLWTRPALSGDWFGLRKQLIDKGVRIDIDVIQTYQGVVGGGNRHRGQYGGSLDIGIDVDTGKAGLWPGGLLHVRAETQFGQSINGYTGSILSSNTDSLFPLADQHEMMLPTVVYTQFLAEWLAVFVGKLDTLDGDGNHFAGARGKDQFVGQNFVFNPTTIRTIPYSGLGGGVMILLPSLWGENKDPIQFTYSVMDAGGQPNVSGFRDAFNEGTAMGWDVRIPTEFFNMPGSQFAGATYSTRNFRSLDPDPRLFLAGLLGLAPPTQEMEGDSYSIFYNFHQYVWVKPDQDRESTGVNPATKLLQGIGVFGRFGYADPNTSPIQGFYSFGVGGRGLVPSRPNDTFGVGVFYVDISKKLPPIIRRRFGDSRGLEAYYNIEITPWLHITPNVQIIDPSNEQTDPATVMGVRAKLTF